MRCEARRFARPSYSLEKCQIQHITTPGHFKARVLQGGPAQQAVTNQLSIGRGPTPKMTVAILRVGQNLQNADRRKAQSTQGNPKSLVPDSLKG